MITINSNNLLTDITQNTFEDNSIKNININKYAINMLNDYVVKSSNAIEPTDTNLYYTGRWVKHEVPENLAHGQRLDTEKTYINSKEFWACDCSRTLEFYIPPFGDNYIFNAEDGVDISVPNIGFYGDAYQLTLSDENGRLNSFFTSLNLDLSVITDNSENSQEQFLSTTYMESTFNWFTPDGYVNTTTQISYERAPDNGLIVKLNFIPYSAYIFTGSGMPQSDTSINLWWTTQEAYRFVPRYLAIKISQDKILGISIENDNSYSNNDENNITIDSQYMTKNLVFSSGNKLKLVDVDLDSGDIGRFEISNNTIYFTYNHQTSSGSSNNYIGFSNNIYLAKDKTYVFKSNILYNNKEVHPSVHFHFEGEEGYEYNLTLTLTSGILTYTPRENISLVYITNTYDSYLDYDIAYQIAIFENNLNNDNFSNMTTAYDTAINDNITWSWGKGKNVIEFDCEFTDYVDEDGVVQLKKSKGEFFRQGDIFKLQLDENSEKIDMIQNMEFMVTNSELNNENGHKYIHVVGQEHISQPLGYVSQVTINGIQDESGINYYVHCNTLDAIIIVKENLVETQFKDGDIFFHQSDVDVSIHTFYIYAKAQNYIDSPLIIVTISQNEQVISKPCGESENIDIQYLYTFNISGSEFVDYPIEPLVFSGSYYLPNNYYVRAYAEKQISPESNVYTRLDKVKTYTVLQFEAEFVQSNDSITWNATGFFYFDITNSGGNYRIALELYKDSSTDIIETVQYIYINYEPKTLSALTWQEIKNVADRGLSVCSKYFTIGDTKTLLYNSGSSTLYHTVRLIDIGKDYNTGGYGYSTITFALDSCFDNDWQSMTYTPMTIDDNIIGYSRTSMYNYLNETILENLEISSLVKPVRKKCIEIDKSDGQINIVDGDSWVWLFSQSEISFTNEYPYNQEGECYQYFEQNPNLIRDRVSGEQPTIAQPDVTIGVGEYWLRTPVATQESANNNTYKYVNQNGGFSSITGDTTEKNVYFGFCL